MHSNEIYQKISENIIYNLQTFKKGEVNNKLLNENLILNLSSMCKFLSGKETLNNSNLDVVVPVSRLELAISNKIRSMNPEGEGEEDDGFNMNNDSLDEDFIPDSQTRETRDNNCNSEVKNKHKDSIVEASSFYRDLNIIDNNNYRESIRSGSVFSKSMRFDGLNNNNNNNNVFDDNFSVINKSEISTIYNKNEMNENNTSMLDFIKNKLKISPGENNKSPKMGQE